MKNKYKILIGIYLLIVIIFIVLNPTIKLYVGELFLKVFGWFFCISPALVILYIIGKNEKYSEKTREISKGLCIYILIAFIFYILNELLN